MKKNKQNNLIVNRDSAFMGSSRAIFISINGQEVGQVNNRSSFQIKLVPGDYLLKCQLRPIWYGLRWLSFSGTSKDFTFTIIENEDKIVTIRAKDEYAIIHAVANVVLILIIISMKIANQFALYIVGASIVLPLLILDNSLIDIKDSPKIDN